MQLQIRSLVPKLAVLMMETYNWDIKRSLDELYRSRTFRMVCDPKCGLYYQGAVYVFTYLQNEIEKGKAE